MLVIEEMSHKWVIHVAVDEAVEPKVQNSRWKERAHWMDSVRTYIIRYPYPCPHCACGREDHGLRILGEKKEHIGWIQFALTLSDIHIPAPIVHVAVKTMGSEFSVKRKSTLDGFSSHLHYPISISLPPLCMWPWRPWAQNSRWKERAHWMDSVRTYIIRYPYPCPHCACGREDHGLRILGEKKEHIGWIQFALTLSDIHIPAPIVHVAVKTMGSEFSVKRKSTLDGFSSHLHYPISISLPPLCMWPWRPWAQNSRWKERAHWMDSVRTYIIRYPYPCPHCACGREDHGLRILGEKKEHIGWIQFALTLSDIHIPAPIVHVAVKTMGSEFSVKRKSTLDGFSSHLHYPISISLPPLCMWPWRPWAQNSRWKERAHWMDSVRTYIIRYPYPCPHCACGREDHGLRILGEKKEHIGWIQFALTLSDIHIPAPIVHVAVKTMGSEFSVKRKSTLDGFSSHLHYPISISLPPLCMWPWRPRAQNSRWKERAHWMDSVRTYIIRYPYPCPHCACGREDHGLRILGEKKEHIGWIQFALTLSDIHIPAPIVHVAVKTMGSEFSVKRKSTLDGFSSHLHYPISISLPPLCMWPWRPWAQNSRWKERAHWMDSVRTYIIRYPYPCPHCACGREDHGLRILGEKKEHIGWIQFALTLSDIHIPAPIVHVAVKTMGSEFSVKRKSTLDGFSSHLHYPISISLPPLCMWPWRPWAQNSRWKERAHWMDSVRTYIIRYPYPCPHCACGREDHGLRILGEKKEHIGWIQFALTLSDIHIPAPIVHVAVKTMGSEFSVKRKSTLDGFSSHLHYPISISLPPLCMWPWRPWAQNSRWKERAHWMDSVRTYIIRYPYPCPHCACGREDHGLRILGEKKEHIGWIQFALTLSDIHIPAPIVHVAVKTMGSEFSVKRKSTLDGFSSHLHYPISISLPPLCMWPWRPWAQNSRWKERAHWMDSVRTYIIRYPYPCPHCACGREDHGLRILGEKKEHIGWIQFALTLSDIHIPAPIVHVAVKTMGSEFSVKRKSTLDGFSSHLHYPISISLPPLCMWPWRPWAQNSRWKERAHWMDSVRTYIIRYPYPCPHCACGREDHGLRILGEKKEHIGWIQFALTLSDIHIPAPIVHVAVKTMGSEFSVKRKSTLDGFSSHLHYPISISLPPLCMWPWRPWAQNSRWKERAHWMDSVRTYIIRYPYPCPHCACGREDHGLRILGEKKEHIGWIQFALTLSDIHIPAPIVHVAVKTMGSEFSVKRKSTLDGFSPHLHYPISISLPPLCMWPWRPWAQNSRWKERAHWMDSVRTYIIRYPYPCPHCACGREDHGLRILGEKKEHIGWIQSALTLSDIHIPAPIVHVAVKTMGSEFSVKRKSTLDGFSSHLHYPISISLPPLKSSWAQNSRWKERAHWMDSVRTYIIRYPYPCPHCACGREDQWPMALKRRHRESRLGLSTCSARKIFL